MLDLPYYGQRLSYSSNKYFSHTEETPPDTAEYTQETQAETAKNIVKTNPAPKKKRVTKEHTKISDTTKQLKEETKVLESTKDIPKLRISPKKKGGIGPTVFYPPQSQSEVSYLAVWSNKTSPRIIL